MHCGINVVKRNIARNFWMRAARSQRTWCASISGKSGVYLALANDLASSYASRNLSNLIAINTIIRKS